MIGGSRTQARREQREDLERKQCRRLHPADGESPLVGCVDATPGSVSHDHPRVECVARLDGNVLGRQGLQCGDRSGLIAREVLVHRARPGRIGPGTVCAPACAAGRNHRTSRQARRATNRLRRARKSWLRLPRSRIPIIPSARHVPFARHHRALAAAQAHFETMPAGRRRGARRRVREQVPLPILRQDSPERLGQAVRPCSRAGTRPRSLPPQTAATGVRRRASAQSRSGV